MWCVVYYKLDGTTQHFICTFNVVSELRTHGTTHDIHCVMCTVVRSTVIFYSSPPLIIYASSSPPPAASVRSVGVTITPSIFASCGKRFKTSMRCCSGVNPS